MREIILELEHEEGTDDKALHFRKFANESKVSHWDPTVYRTFVDADERKKFVFVTTSAEIYKNFDAQRVKDHCKLAKLLHNDFAVSGDSDVILFNDSARRMAIYVRAFPAKDDVVTYAFSHRH